MWPRDPNYKGAPTGLWTTRETQSYVHKYLQKTEEEKEGEYMFVFYLQTETKTSPVRERIKQKHIGVDLYDGDRGSSQDTHFLSIFNF